MKKLLIFSVFTLYAIFSSTLSQILNPDSKYPIPNNYGDKIYEGVNLFSGTLNLELQLEEISGHSLTYPVKAMYNSRTPALIKDRKITRADNELGGYGWKLMDYYKIYHDQAAGKYYFVDGERQYLLTFKEQRSGYAIYTMDGKYYLWQFSIGNGYAAAASENGTRYYFQPSVINSNTGMNLWKIVNENKTDTLTFSYNSDNYISSIKNILGDSLYFHYNRDNHLDYIAHYSNLSNGTTAASDLTELNYNSDSLLTFISFLKDADINDGIAEYTFDNMGWSFSYYASGFTKFLEILKSPTGKETVYTYKQLSINNTNYDVVLKTRDNNGTNAHNNSFIYTIENAKKSPDSIYTYFNTVRVYPGTKSDSSLTSQYFTSFETTNATDDPLIDHGNGVMGSTSYAHSGIYSLDFNYNNQSAYAVSRTLVSEKLALIQNGEVSPDSVSVSYYWYAQYVELLGNTAYFGAVVNIKLRFYNSEGNEIDGNFYKETLYDLIDYGNRWNLFSYSVQAPANAKKVRFEITETPGKGFYNIDDFSLKGGIAPPNGVIAYNFINGKESSFLNGLPSDYYTEVINETTTLGYFTGFESGQKESWLGISHSTDISDLNYANYLPKFTKSGYNNIHSFEGDYALEMKCKANDTTHSSSIYLANPVTVPANTSRVYVQLQYTAPSVHYPMYLNIIVTINGRQLAYLLANTGDNSKWPGYYMGTSLNYTVNPGDIVQFRITASGAVDNSIYIDNLSLRFVNNAEAVTANNLTEVDNNPLYLGKLYSYRIFKRTDSEIESSFLYYTTHTSPKNAANKYLQTNRLTGILRGSARIISNNFFNDEGLLSKTLQTKYIRRTDGNDKKDTVYLKTERIYAYQQYPDLGPEGRNILTPVAATVSSVSTDYGVTWDIKSAGYEQWIKWNSAGLPDAVNGSIWETWRSFDLKKKISVQQMADVLNNFKNNSTYTPPSDDWIYAENTTKRFPKTFEESSFFEQDSAIINIIYSNGMPSTGGNAKQEYNPIATFYNDDSDRSMYFGFEQYEPDTSTVATSSFSSQYAFTGTRSKSNGFGTTFKYNNTANPNKKYLIGFWASSVDASTYFDIQVEDSSNRQIFSSPSQTFTPGSWQYIERVFTLPSNLTEVQIRIIPRGTNANILYLDDLRIGTTDAQMTATIYDADRNVITAEIDNNANVTRYVYDPFNNKIAEIGNDYVPRSISLYDAKRRKEINHLLPAVLNSQVNMDIQGNGTYFNFKDMKQNNLWFPWFPAGQQPGDAASYINNTDGKIYVNKNSTFTYQPPAHHSGADAGISFTVNLGDFTGKRSDINNAAFVVTTNNRTFGALPRIQSNKYLIDYYLHLDGSHNYTVTDTVYYLANTVQQWCIVYTELSLIWYINGKMVQKITDYSFNNDTPPVFSTHYDVNNVIWVKDIIIFTKPVQQTSFIDGEGNTVQDQHLVNTSLVTQQTVYDEMNRPFLETKPAVTSGTFGYVNNFISSYSRHTGKMQGQVENAATYIDKASDDDKYYMYEQTVYDNSPFNNKAESYRAGAYYSLIGPSYEQTQLGNFAKAVNWLYYHSDQIGETIQILGYAADLIDVAVNPEDPLAWLSIAMDAENVIQDYFVKHYMSNNADTTLPAVTSYYYDKNGRLILIKLPGYSSGDTLQTISFGYDFSGNVIKKKAPESGVTRNVYDDSFRLRFMQAEGKGDTVIYFKYAKAGELIEKGYFLYHWTEDTQDDLESLANNRNYPATENSHLLIQWTYGDNIYSAASRNRIYSTNTLNIKTGNNVSEKYIYDGKGQVLSQSTYFSSTSDTFTVNYRYDKLGKVTNIIYPSAGTFTPLNINYTFNDAGLIRQVNTSAGETISDYGYNPDETISYKYLYYSDRTRTSIQNRYTAPGYLSMTDYSNFFKNSYNYNFAGWFDNLRDNPQYGGYTASSQFDPTYYGSGNTFGSSFNYDERGNLSHYRKNGNSHTDSDEYNLSFNSNNNLVSAGANYSSTNTTYIQDTIVISSLYNRPQYNYKFRNDQGANSLPRSFDTTSISFYPDGNVQKINSHVQVTDRSTFSGYDSTFHKQKSFYYTPDDLTYFIDATDSVKGTSAWNKFEKKVYFDYQAYNDRKQKRVVKYRNGNYDGETIKQYIHGTNDMPLAEIISEKNSLNAVTRKEMRCYIYDEDGIVGMFSYNLLTGTQSSYFVLPDDHGSAVHVINRVRATLPVAEYSYNSYGSIDPYGVNKNTGFYSYLYTGQEFDSETELYNYKVRFYDPSLKYFLSPDPEMQDPALPYAYAGNNPVNYTDPTGEAYTTSRGRLVKKTTKLIEEIAAPVLSVEKRTGSLRLKYLGATPGKGSRTGRDLLEQTWKRDVKQIKKLGLPPADKLPRARWTGKGLVDLNDLNQWEVYIEAPKNAGSFKKGDPTEWKWVKLDKEVDMGHVVDAVSEWNNTFRKIKNYVTRLNVVRKWMRNAKNYEFEFGLLNSLKGAILGRSTRYLPPVR